MLAAAAARLANELRARPDEPMLRVRYAEALMALQRIGDALREYHKAADMFLDAGSARKARAVYMIILSHDPADAYADKQRRLCDTLCMDTTSQVFAEPPDSTDGVIPRYLGSNATTQTRGRPA